jgi:hypothetical protein
MSINIKNKEAERLLDDARSKPALMMRSSVASRKVSRLTSA